MLMGNGAEGTVFSIPDRVVIRQWHHERGDATSGHFSEDHRLVELRTEQVGEQMMRLLSEEVRDAEPDGAFYNYQVVGHGTSFVPWLSANTATFEWRASVRVTHCLRRPGLGGEHVVVVAWKPNANGSASEALPVVGRGPALDPAVVGIRNARQALYGGRGWAGNRSTARGRGRGLRGDEEPWPAYEEAAGSALADPEPMAPPGANAAAAAGAAHPKSPPPEVQQMIRGERPVPTARPSAAERVEQNLVAILTEAAMAAPPGSAAGAVHPSDARARVRSSQVHDQVQWQCKCSLVGESARH